MDKALPRKSNVSGWQATISQARQKCSYRPNYEAIACLVFLQKPPLAKRILLLSDLGRAIEQQYWFTHKKMEYVNAISGDI